MELRKSTKPPDRLDQSLEYLRANSRRSPGDPTPINSAPSPSDDNAVMPDPPAGAGKNATMAPRFKVVKKRRAETDVRTAPPQRDAQQLSSDAGQPQQQNPARGPTGNATRAGAQPTPVVRQLLTQGGKGGGSVTRKPRGRPPKKPVLPTFDLTPAPTPTPASRRAVVPPPPVLRGGNNPTDNKIDQLAAAWLSCHGVPEQWKNLRIEHDGHVDWQLPEFVSKFNIKELVARANGEKPEKPEHVLALEEHRKHVAKNLYDPQLAGEPHPDQALWGKGIEKPLSVQMADSDEEDEAEPDTSKFKALHPVLQHTLIHALWSDAFDDYANPYYPVQVLLQLRPGEIMAIEDEHRLRRDDPTRPKLETPTPCDVTMAFEYLAERELPAGLLSDWDREESPMVDRFPPQARPRK